MTNVYLVKNTLYFEGELTIPEIKKLDEKIADIFPKIQDNTILINLNDVDRIDSAGVAFLDEITVRTEAKGMAINYIDVPENIKKIIHSFTSKTKAVEHEKEHESVLEKIGSFVYSVLNDTKSMIFLISDSFYFAVIGLFKRHGQRKGEFINQSIIIGMNAFPIVALVSFLIGLILALQSAAQLRQFGASIFVADLVSISMTREMGPIMTAIIFAGRSGSSIASEVATMVVTEETDALRAMALNPIRYIIVPKIYAITLTLPLLTILSMLIGIFGAIVIGISYLNLGLEAFYTQVVNALVLKDIITGLVKSVIFAWIIVLVGAFYGFRVKGGAESVGRTTTAAVVTSIFMVILADSILGLIFYFGQGLNY